MHRDFRCGQTPVNSKNLPESLSCDSGRMPVANASITRDAGINVLPGYPVRLVTCERCCHCGDFTGMSCASAPVISTAATSSKSPAIYTVRS